MARSIAGSGDAPPGSLSNDLDLATDGLTKRSGNQGEFSEKHTVFDNNEESSIEEGSKPTHDHTHRKLKPRHVQLIGIGGTIGTALYVQIGRGLANGGPASLFLAFTICRLRPLGVFIGYPEIYLRKASIWMKSWTPL
ncbi:hypothetical protein BJX66DRAFT_89231 [Aspergillus keveii]|uniref:Amino acid permease/ SLC12A domain-containing protein n=1 Tax=Aspergillus keveii TaxID=714993 RepID=A0ABR4FMS8_9EURO